MFFDNFGSPQVLIGYALRFFCDLTCTGTCQQDAAHHLPTNFSDVESFSRWMVSTETWSLHFSTEQTEAVCSTLPISFLFYFGKRGWARGKSSLLMILVSNPEPPYPDPTKLNAEGYSLASLCSFFLRLYFCGSSKKKCLGFGIWICCACNKEMWDQLVVLFT